MNIERYDFLNDDEAVSFVALMSGELLNIVQARKLENLAPMLQEVHRISVSMKKSNQEQS